MAPKRPHEDDSARPEKKQRKTGFQVGPANLPDGVHKRKVQKIKEGLIHKAKLYKQLEKIKAREEPIEPKLSVYERAEANGLEMPNEPAAVHPDRVRMLEEPSPEPEVRLRRKEKRPRSQTYKNETAIAQKKKEEAEARRKAREEAEKERQAKLAERERFRKVMAKARGGRDGKRKLGRESTVLLERVKRMMGNA